jgi:hypothetical protein
MQGGNPAPVCRDDLPYLSTWLPRFGGETAPRTQIVLKTPRQSPIRWDLMRRRHVRTAMNDRCLTALCRYLGPGLRDIPVLHGTLTQRTRARWVVGVLSISFQPIKRYIQKLGPCWRSWGGRNRISQLPSIRDFPSFPIPAVEDDDNGRPSQIFHTIYPRL